MFVPCKGKISLFRVPRTKLRIFKLDLSIAVLMLFMTGVRALFSLWPLAANFAKLGAWCEGIFIALPVWHRASVPLQFVASLAF